MFNIFTPKSKHKEKYLKWYLNSIAPPKITYYKTYKERGRINRFIKAKKIRETLVYTW